VTVHATRFRIGSDVSCRAAKAYGETAEALSERPLLGTKGPRKANRKVGLFHCAWEGIALITATEFLN